jgi:hypothetical protein
MAFEEDLDAFLDVAGGFAVDATLDDVPVKVIFDAAALDEIGVATGNFTALIKGSDGAAADSVMVFAAMPSQLARYAGTYSIRSVTPEPPDGAFDRATLVKTA